jgi:hypothetical protein
MKNIPVILLLLLALALLPACDQTVTPPAGNTAGDFLKNTEWVGTFRPLSRMYDKPFCLRFNSDNSLTIYGVFYFLIDGNLVPKDSLVGKISKIEDTGTDISISVDFPFISESHTLVVTDRKTLSHAGVLDPSRPNSFSYGLRLFPAGGVSVRGTTWSGPIMKEGPIKGAHAYPDLSGIHFFEDSSYKNGTFYTRNGERAQMKVPQASTYSVVYSVYQQRGARVYMNGFNESGSKLIPYFGVLDPSGNIMWVDSPTNEARLPNWLETIAWYGPAGVTPVIYKHK